MPFEASVSASFCTIWEFTMLAKLFQEFQPIGAAPKAVVANAETKTSHEERIRKHITQIEKGRVT
jgi:hypothetical protein